jgi:hypothetical protein
VGVTATTDHPIPMQLLSTSVGAAAKKHAVPPKPDVASHMSGVAGIIVLLLMHPLLSA